MIYVLCVSSALETIERDPRHKGVLRLLRGERDERQFGDGAMGFRNTNRLPPNARAEISDFLQKSRTESAAENTEPIPAALKMLQTFRQLTM